MRAYNWQKWGYYAWKESENCRKDKMIWIFIKHKTKTKNKAQLKEHRTNMKRGNQDRSEKRLKI